MDEEIDDKNWLKIPYRHLSYPAPHTSPSTPRKLFPAGNNLAICHQALTFPASVRISALALMGYVVWEGP